MIREDKKGYIPGKTPRILGRLNIDPEQFIATSARMLQQFSTAIGTPEHLTAHCVTRNIAFLRGMSAARALFERKGGLRRSSDRSRKTNSCGSAEAVVALVFAWTACGV